MASCSCSSIMAISALAQTFLNFKEYNGLHRSNSSKDFPKRAICMQRSYSDNHICYIHGRATQPWPKINFSSSFANLFPFQLPNSIRSFLFEMEDVTEKISYEEEEEDDDDDDDDDDDVAKRANWVERLLQIRSHWRRVNKTGAGEKEIGIGDQSYEDDDDDGGGGGGGGCEVDYGSELDEDEDGELRLFDAESFANYLIQVPSSDTQLFSQLAFLSNMAYIIPQIKEKDLKRQYGLQFITSSLHKKAEAAIIKEKMDHHHHRRHQHSTPLESSPSVKAASDAYSDEKQATIPTSVAYEIAAKAASYVQSISSSADNNPVLSHHYSSVESSEEDSSSSSSSMTMGEKLGESSSRAYNPEVAAYVAASTMTAVVAAQEIKKKETAKDLQSLHSSPCEWFVCDDSTTLTRCFVIQGSDSLASWQANLFFEPSKFEGTDVVVHRGIYEAAKGIYKQFMPEIVSHLKKHGKKAKFQLTGHSLGGSLSVIVHLMLVKNGIVEAEMLEPVVTFGSPFVLCGGKRLLDELGLDENDFHCVIMHRDIVPRAFSCNYPDHVAALLKRLNGSFKSHSCLNRNKLLYSPLGKLFILQPDEKSSPPHPLLPQGSALYTLDKTKYRYPNGLLRAFLNCPHPLETLSDPSAYGSEGTILRDHDSSFYLKALNGVLKQQANMLLPLLASPSSHLWSHDTYLENNSFLSNEVTTGV